MSDIKISQLTSVSSLNATDLFAISRSIIGGNWQSNSITASNVLNSLSSTRLLKVAKDGIRDADTIKDAVALAVALSPTEFNPVAIQVFPGAYVEDNPINIPQWVSIYSEGGVYSVGVIADNDGNIFVTNGNSTLNGLTIIGLTPPPLNSNVAYQSTTATTGTISNCIIVNCQTGILSNNGSIVASFITGLSFQRVFDKFFSVVNGGFLTAVTCNLTGVLTRPTYAFYSSDTDSELYLFSCVANNCINGMYANNNGYIDSFANHFAICDNAIHVGPNGSSGLKIVGCIMDEDNVSDLTVESITAKVALQGHVDSHKFNIVNGATVNTVAEDEGVNGGLIMGLSSFQGKVGIGVPGAISLGLDMQLNVGEGSAFSVDAQGNPIVEYWSYNASTHSFARFVNNAGTQLANSNDALIVGCKFQFPSIRLDINVPAVLGSADFITEYWNGSSWTSITIAAYRRSDFARRANKPFQNVETQFVEFSGKIFSNGNWTEDINIADNIPPWTANEKFYAIRFRNDGALTSGMQFANGLVKPHSFMVSTSGYKANFGIYRTEKTLYVDSTNFTSDPINPPSFTNLQISTNIGYSQQPNFAKILPISQVAVAFVMPFDIGTASPLQMFIDGIATTSDTGNMISTVYIARIDASSPPISIPISDYEVGPEVTAAPGIANGFMTVYQEIDISAYNPGDTLFISFLREASDLADTYTGDFVVGDITFKYKSKFV
jgi:hypothetical protein